MNSNKDITHTFAWQLDIGRKRLRNEDSVGAAKISRGSADNDLSVGIYVIADGVGGEEDGDKASRMAVETVMAAMLSKIGIRHTEEEYRKRLESATLLAHRQIRIHREQDRGTLTTLVCALIVDETVYIANVGDSRAYVLQGNHLRQITTDHTVAQSLLESGALTAEQVQGHYYNNVLSQALGASQPVKADVYTEHLQVNDYLLLCSDGLYNAISEEDMLRIITESEDTQTASKQLIKAANDAGGPDNISVVLVQLKKREHAHVFV